MHPQTASYGPGCGGGRMRGRHVGYHRNFGNHYGRRPFQVPVNIEETPDTFEVYVAAPGRTKEAFGISVQDDVLTVSFQPLENEAESPRNWRRREFAKVPFERSFFLNGKVDSAGITATYQEGILHVTLPKSAAASEPPQKIMIA